MKTTIKYNQPTRRERLIHAYNDARSYLTERQWQAMRQEFVKRWTEGQLHPGDRHIKFRLYRIARRQLTFMLDFCGVDGLPVYAVARALVDTISPPTKRRIIC